MQHLPIYVVIVVVGALLVQSEAKRGCALYGHSCYGGHGKRADMPRGEFQPIESGSPPTDKSYQNNINKELYPDNNNNNNNDFNGINQLDTNNDWRWKSKTELDYAIYNLLRQWIDDAKKSAAEAQRTSEGDTIFKNNLV